MSDPLTHLQRIAKTITYYENERRPVRPGRVMVSAVGYGLLLDETKEASKYLFMGKEEEGGPALMLMGWPVFPDYELEPFDFRIVPS